MKITTPKINVIYTNDQGQQVQDAVQTTAADQYTYDMLCSNKKNIPELKKAPATWGYILAWAALRRLGKITENDFDYWIRTALIDADIALEGEEEVLAHAPEELSESPTN